MKLRKGVLIVFEGIDGSGKSTQAGLLLRMFKRLGIAAVSFREPSKSRWGKEIRRKAIHPDSLTPQEELSLFLKDRRYNVSKNLRPALERKKAVILDRYYFSTIAYQGAKGIETEKIRRLNERFAVKPDLVFVLDIGPGQGLARIKDRKKKDRLFEDERYLKRVRKIFRSLKGETVILIDARQPPQEIHRRIARRAFRLIQRHSLSA